ncbi:sce7726 family protein, partial [Xanthomonas perforans]
LKDIASGNYPAEVANVREHIERIEAGQANAALRDIYEAAFRHCRGSARGEHVYKNALVEKIVIGRHSLTTSSVHFEVRMRSAKLDVLIARQFLSAYEIKTELDELSRLGAQIEEYRKFCQEVWVFTCDKHLSACERQLPDTVGLAVLTKRYQIRVARPATSCVDALETDSMLRLLRKQEQVDLLKYLGIDVLGIPNTMLASQLKEAAGRCSVLEIQAKVAEALRARGTNQAKMARYMPKSLIASVLAQDLTIPQQLRLIEAFKE